MVLNEKAVLGYETNRDACKFASMDTQTPQLYTLDTNGTRYAINERPTADGTVQIGFSTPTAGTYTLSVKRNRNFGQVMLLDRETGLNYDITDDGYTFYAEAGTNNSRLVLMATEATGISETADTTDGNNTTVSVYDLSGRKTSAAMHSGIYIEHQTGGKVRKSIVK